jgi:putative nucleotidyltransferase with HDIG domain
MPINSHLDAMTRALLAAQTARDVETGGHTARVRRLALRLGAAFGLPSESLVALDYGALLHDVGKISTPDLILKKPGRHNQGETAIMRKHAESGAEMLRSLGFPERIVLVVAEHHERWDGCGYPRGLRRYEICPEARVFSVADTLDAILHDRVYRAGNSFEAARVEIELHSGKQFDPEVVAAFLRVERREWLETAHQQES